MTGSLDRSPRQLADQILLARSERRPLGVPDRATIPATAVEAYRVDDVVADALRRPVRGWKVGCTSEAAKRILGADGPFSGRIYDVLDDGAAVPPSLLVAEPMVEGEFAFTIGVDLPAIERQRSRAEVADAVASVHPAIEIVGGRFAQFVGTPLLCLVADAGANSLLVRGSAVDLVDVEALRSATATMVIDGQVTGTGRGSDVLGDPLDALLWLVNHVSGRGFDLEAGQIVTTGTATQIAPLPVGSTATASLDGIGSVSVVRPGSA